MKGAETPSRPALHRQKHHATSNNDLSESIKKKKKKCCFYGTGDTRLLGYLGDVARNSAEGGQRLPRERSAEGARKALIHKLHDDGIAAKHRPALSTSGLTHVGP